MQDGIYVTDTQIRHYRLKVHHLDRLYPPESLLEATGVCGIQNSPPGGWETALFARLARVSQDMLQNALEREKSLLQAWSFRGTPVVFPTAQSAVFLSALVAHPGEEPWIYTRGVTLALEALGISWPEALAWVQQAAEYLDTHTVQRKEELDRVLAARVAEQLPAGLRQRWQAPSPYGRPDRQNIGEAVVSFALRPCAFLGLVVFGARQGIHPTFTSFYHWNGWKLSADSGAEEQLVQKFLHAYGPATRSDFAAWLGASPAQSRRLWACASSRMVPVRKRGKTAWLLEEDLPALREAEPPAAPWTLLGPHDPYLDARDRGLLLEEPALQRQVWQTVSNPGVLLCDGRVAALWKTRRLHQGMEMTLVPLETLPVGAEAWCRAQSEHYAVFRGLKLARFTIAEK